MAEQRATTIQGSQQQTCDPESSTKTGSHVNVSCKQTVDPKRELVPAQAMGTDKPENETASASRYVYGCCSLHFRVRRHLGNDATK